MTGLASVVVHASPLSVCVCVCVCECHAQVNKACLGADEVLRLSGLGRRPALTSRTGAGCCLCAQGRDRAVSPAALPPAQTPGGIAAPSASLTHTGRGESCEMKTPLCLGAAACVVFNHLKPDPRELQPKIFS